MPTQNRWRLAVLIGGMALHLASAAMAAGQEAAVQDIAPADTIQPVLSLSSDGREFIGAFNAAADQTRLVLLLSPT